MHYEDSLKSMVEGLGMQFVIADLYRANLSMDKVDWDKGMIFLYMSPSKKETTVSIAGMLPRAVPINAFILGIVKQKTSDFEYAEVKPTIRLAEQYADRIVHTLNDLNTANNVTDPEKPYGIEKFSFQDTYDEFDASIHGGVFTCIWNVNELTRGC